MIAPWLLYSVIVAVLCGAAARAAGRFCRMVRVPARWVWVVGMITALGLSTVALGGLGRAHESESSGAVVMPKVTGGTAESEAGSVQRVLGAIRYVSGAAGSVMESALEGVHAAAVRLDARRIAVTFGALWVGASLTLLLLLSATLVRVRRARTSWRPYRIDDVPVLVSRSDGPALVGLLQPAIVVPEWLLAESAERQRLVVRHEREHQRAGDHAVLAVACAIACLLPWNPAVWWMLKRLRLAVELDCDARVLRAGAGARSYGALLLDIAGRTSARPFSAPALADSRTHLERRLLAMTEKRHTPSRVRAAAVGACALLLAVAACATEMPTAAAIDDLDVEEVQVQAEKTGLLRATGAPVFIIDGVVVTEIEARALDPEEIASIEVVKADASLRAYGQAGAEGVVVVATKLRQAMVAGELREKRPLGTEVAETEVLETRQRAREVELRSAAGEGTVRFRAAASPAETPLIIVDGVIVSPSFNLNQLDPESIDQIEIVKGEAARRLYSNPRALNGVITITTKKR